MSDIVKNAYRDPTSGAVIFNDQAEYHRARLRKKHSREVYERNQEVLNLRDQMEKLMETTAALMAEMAVLRANALAAKEIK